MKYSDVFVFVLLAVRIAVAEITVFERHISLLKSYVHESISLKTTENLKLNFENYGNIISVNVKRNGIPVDYSYEEDLLSIDHSGNIQIDTIYDSLKPIPSEIKITDSQKLYFKFDLVPNCNVPIKKYQLSIDGVSKGRLIDNSLKSSNGKLVHSEEFVEPNTVYSTFIQYDRNLPLKKATLRKQIWVSHWSNSLTFQESYDLSNNAASLSSGFSRVDYLKNNMGNNVNPSINNLEFHLPIKPHSVSYTDLVGNVSTSILRDNILWLRPRYPVFGGWNYNFTISYSNSIAQFVNRLTSTQYIAQLPVLNKVQDIIYDDVTLDILLPENAKFVSYNCSLPFEAEEGNEFSYWDFYQGHPVIRLNFGKLVDETNGVVYVVYEYSLMDSLWTVVSVIGWVATALFAIWALKRIDISVK